MKRLSACLLAAALILALPGCKAPEAVSTPTPAPQVSAPVEEQLPFALGYDGGASLHPITGDSRINQELASLVYEGLFELDNSFMPHPVLARSASHNESGLVWTIELREDAVFSDGTPLTADHVVSSLKLARKSGFYAARLADVTGVREKDGAVVITLSKPNGALPALLDIPIVLEQISAPPVEVPPLGTGRYRFVGSGDKLALMINGNRPDWDSLPWLSIPLREVSAADRRIAAFDGGEISLVTADFSDDYTMGYSCSYETWDYPTTNLLYVGFRTTEESPCGMAEIRKACSMAFGRTELTSQLLKGRGDPTCLPVSPAHREYDRNIAALLDRNEEEAAALLDRAGYKLKDDGLRYKGRTPLKLKLVVNRDSGFKDAAAAMLADCLAGLGVTVEVSRLNWGDYLKALKEGKFDLYLGEIRLTADFDVTPLLTGQLNYGGWVSEEAPALLAAWKGSEDEARTDAARLLWELLAREAPIAPLCFKQNTLLVRWGTVSNMNPTRGDLFRDMDGWNLIQ